LPDYRANPYVFVVGCPRSGTTLLQRMLDHHPQLVVANDSHFVTKAIRGAGAENPPLTPDLVDRVCSYPRFGRLGISEATARRLATGASSYAAFVSTLYDELARLHGKPLAGEKTPDYVRRIPELHRLFPEARFVHLIRDGRDVALSALEWARPGKGPGRFALWAREPVAVCALWWKRFIRAGIREGRSLGQDHYMEVRFEDLVARPRETMEHIAGFLDLPLADEMLAFHEGRTRVRPGRSVKNAWLPPTPGLRDWHSEMSQEHVELYEALVGDLLAELGYERAFSEISGAVSMRAERCRYWWAAERPEVTQRSATSTVHWPRDLKAFSCSAEASARSQARHGVGQIPPGPDRREHPAIAYGPSEKEAGIGVDGVQVPSIGAEAFVAETGSTFDGYAGHCIVQGESAVGGKGEP
jgi:Sulfotransferase family